MSAEQAGLLAGLWAGPQGLLERPRPCSIAELQALYARCAHLPGPWEQLCALWDTALVHRLPTPFAAMHGRPCHPLHVP